MEDANIHIILIILSLVYSPSFLDFRGSERSSEIKINSFSLKIHAVSFFSLRKNMASDSTRFIWLEIKSEVRNVMNYVR